MAYLGSRQLVEHDLPFRRQALRVGVRWCVGGAWGGGVGWGGYL